MMLLSCYFFFFNDTATTEIYTILFVGSVRCVQRQAKNDAIQNLVNKLTELDTCTEYSQAASLRSDYEALSEDEKVLFAREKIVDEDESGAEVPVNAMTKLEYMEYLNQIKANTSGANNNAMMKIENTTSIYFVAIISVVGLVSVLGYYFISKKRKFN